MARNSIGNFNLAVPPVQGGTVIDPDAENLFRSDLATEITDSLSRSGKGGMTAPLKLATGGSAALPSLGFVADPDTGFYQPAVDQLAVVSNATEMMRWTLTGITAKSVFTAPGISVTDGEVLTEDLTATGSTSLASLDVGGAAAFHQFVSSDVGGLAYSIRPGTLDHCYLELIARTATPSTRSGLLGFGGAGTPVLTLQNMIGDLFFVVPSGSVARTNSLAFRIDTTAPSAATAIANSITQNNIVKAELFVSSNITGSITVNDGFNIAASTPAQGISGGLLRFNFNTPFADTNYRVQITLGSITGFGVVSAKTTTRVDIALYKLSVGSPANSSVLVFNGTSDQFDVYVTCTGRQ